MSGPERLAPFLLEILVDPVDKGPLYYFAEESLLYNPRRHLGYAVRGEIPVLLESEARMIEGEAAVRLESGLGEAIETGGGS